MELTNHMSRSGDDSEQGRAVADEGWKAIVRLLAPMTPHICEALWAALGETTPLTSTAWPVADESARERSSLMLVIQVNGKVRARIEVAPGCDRDSAAEAALGEANVQRHIEGKTIRKIIHVPDRLLNIVAT